MALGGKARDVLDCYLADLAICVGEKGEQL
jgi:hypothetical protein